jgi:5'-3' exonuclease
MGVKGLLPCLQSITRQVALEKYRGLTVAVDAMCWLHKGIFTGNVGALAKYQFMDQQESEELIEMNTSKHPRAHHDQQLHNPIMASTVKRLDFNKVASRVNRFENRSVNNNTGAIEAMSKCIDYVIRHSRDLQKTHGLEILLVIDGDSLPSKHTVNEKRRNDRAEAFQQGLKAERRGDGRQARKFFSKACSISYEMRHELVIQCKRFSIPFIVAPYEADAQMAKLAHSGDVDLVITEDSDLLVYGCPRVLFKIDFKTGKGDEIQLMNDLAANEPLSFRHWNHDMFVYMCILAGCDYCEGIPGVGLQTAHKLVRIHRKPKKIFNALKLSGKLPGNFEESFWNAYRTFRHQRVFCPQKREINNLFEIQKQGDTKKLWDFLGPWIEPSIGIGIAEGALHPREKVAWHKLVHKQKQILQSEPNMSAIMPVRSHERKRLPMERSPIGKETIHDFGSKTKVSDDKNLFAFFRPKKRNNNNKKESNRPPLQVIQVDQNSDSNILSLHLDGDLGGKYCHQTIPSNYHEYSSQLVSGNFEPISRNNLGPPIQRRKGVSKAIRDLKKKLSLKRVNNRSKDLERKDNTSRLMKVDRGNVCSYSQKQDQNLSQSVHSSGSQTNNDIIEVAQKLAQRDRYCDILPTLDSDNILQPINDNGTSIYIPNDDQQYSVDFSKMIQDDYYTVDSNFSVEPSTSDAPIDYSKLGPECNDNIRKSSNEFDNLVYSEFSESLSSTVQKETIFSNHNQHRALSHGVTSHGNDEIQYVLPKTTHLKQRESVTSTDLTSFAFYDEKENLQKNAHSHSCFFQDSRQEENLGLDHDEHLILPYYNCDDDTGLYKDEGHLQPRTDPEDNGLLEQIDYFRRL